MSAVLDTHGHAHHGDHSHHPSGIMRWITTTNHKDIGTMPSKRTGISCSTIY